MFLPDGDGLLLVPVLALRLQLHIEVPKEPSRNQP